MNVVTAVKLYIEKITNESGPGMKIILMDKETTSVISMALSQSDMLKKEVYLFERIDSGRSNERLKYLKCIVFIRPTKQNLALLAEELRSPKYGAYYIYFSNIIPRTDIKMLAECDESESVREIKEIYVDYLCVNQNLFSLNIPFCMSHLAWLPEALTRTLQGITSILLSLKFQPVIRYRAGSVPAQTLAKQIYDQITKESTLFDFNAYDNNGVPPPLLLILDRRDDPVTPLLHQWTYQAMVHELLSINNNRVDLSEVVGIPKDLKEVVLSAEQDDFYAANMYSNFGEIGSKIKSLMEEFQKKAKDQRKVESIADMKNFVETYPQFRKMSGTVTKHVCVVGELSNLTAKRMLFDISELEQEMACKGDHSAQLQRVKKLVADEKISLDDALKLICLYALRYERHANCDTLSLLQTLKNRGGKAFVVPRLLEYAGQHARQGELFNLVRIADAVKLTRNLIKGLKGIENVFTQHTCLLKEILEEVFKGRDLDPMYPNISSDVPSFRRPPQQVICFIIGGASYEEALAVHQMNNAGYKVILGATTIHNSESFIKEVLQATSGINFKHTKPLEKFHMFEGI
ncbi:vacuolar protein sorting-associated protein 45 [Condylostylus longicornis]|uniref:vacuolar protein sorting-associated protein 45 n=1 Tax=Condylostylus longicornis TaxID=2530218 RepID=UPI00244DF387|nr:vacuolar protein sorting-associated protein 45 [Condylostylus longicornis]